MSRSLHRIATLARPALILGLVTGIAPLPAAAVEVEPYLFAAYRDADLSFPPGIACVTVVGQGCPTSASTEDGDEDAWGLGAAVHLRGPWWLDLRWSRQETEVRYFDRLGNEAPLAPVPLEISYLHAGALYRFLGGRWSPFLTAFGGLSRLDSDAETLGRPEIDLDRTAWGVGGGLLVDLGRRTGVRLEVRGSRTDLPRDFDGDLEQVEGSAALRLRL